MVNPGGGGNSKVFGIFFPWKLGEDFNKFDLRIFFRWVGLKPHQPWVVNAGIFPEPTHRFDWCRRRHRPGSAGPGPTSFPSRRMMGTGWSWADSYVKGGTAGGMEMWVCLKAVWLVRVCFEGFDIYQWLLVKCYWLLGLSLQRNIWFIEVPMVGFF